MIFGQTRKCMGMAVLTVILVMLWSSFSVNAQGVTTHNGIAEFGKGKAQITIHGKQGKSLVGKKFTVHQLFFAENSAELESIHYQLNPVYEKSLQKLVAEKENKPKEEITERMIIDFLQTMNTYPLEGAQSVQQTEGGYSSYRYFAEELQKQIKADGIEGTEVRVLDTYESSTIILKGLPYGYYMVFDTSDTAEKHTAASLCMITTANPDAQVNVKADYPVVDKKIKEDGESGWNDIGDYEVGQKVPYRFESDVPDMTGYHTYYYAWQDVMNEALQLCPESISILISDKSGSQKYEVKESEYELSRSKEGENYFEIRIMDLKKIIDREFPERNAKKIVLRYDAILTDKAAENTGNPGFENDVRLEFSNNPNIEGVGETGYTPWDTVVCFTYRLEGMKVNNKGDGLKEAEFRLYYDESCEQEVLVYEKNGKYIVNHKDTIAKQTIKPAKIISDSVGSFVIYGLDGGTYYLKEVAAPAGYRPILDPVKIQIQPQFVADRNSYIKGEKVLELNAKAQVKLFQNGRYEGKEIELQTEEEEGSVQLSVVNQIGKKLPTTGSVWMAMLFITGSACVIYSFVKGKKNE